MIESIVKYIYYELNLVFTQLHLNDPYYVYRL